MQLPNRQVLAYQSRTGPVKWIGPGTEEVLAELGDEGVTDVLVVPLSFVSDHIETLYEVDMLFADAARAAGITGYYRPAALKAIRCSSKRWRVSSSMTERQVRRLRRYALDERPSRANEPALVH